MFEYCLPTVSKTFINSLKTIVETQEKQMRNTTNIWGKVFNGGLGLRQ